MHSLFYLAHLVQTKNDLNRKRRRFYAILNPRHEYKDKPMHKAFTRETCERGYREAQSDMKAMTKHMRQVCKEIDAKFVWGSGGQIQGIKHEGKKYWECFAYSPESERFSRHSDISALAEHYKVEQLIAR